MLTKKIFSLLFFLFLIAYVYSQNPRKDRVIWRSSEVTEANGGEVVKIQSELITSKEKIIWAQDGVFEQEMEVVSFSGGLNDLSKDGVLNINVRVNGNQGKVKIQKKGDEITAQIRFQIDGSDDSKGKTKTDVTIFIDSFSAA